MSGLAWKMEVAGIKVASAQRLAAPAPRVGEVPPDMQEKLQAKVALSFDAVPLPAAVDYLAGVTGVGCELLMPDYPLDGLAVSLSFAGTLEQALDLICWLTETSWTVQGGAVKIIEAARAGAPT